MGFRFVLLQVAVFAICAGALINPLIGLYGYIWYSLARPDALSWSEGSLPHSLIIAICTIAGAWRFIPNFRYWWNPWVFSLILLQLIMLLSCFFAQFPGLSWTPYWNFFKYLAIALLIPLFIIRLQEFRWLFFVVAFSIGLIGFRFGVFGLRAGGIHIESGLGGFMSDNNTLALAILMGIPFIWYSQNLVSGMWRKGLIYLGTFTSMAAVVMTESRAGILAMGAMCLTIVWRSKHKVAMLVVLAVLTLPTALLVSDSLGKRMSTLSDYQRDGSAASRIAYQKAALAMWRDYPVLGVGFGTYNWVALSSRYLGANNEKEHVVHNNYLQMATDSGTFAVVLLLWQIFYSIYWLNKNAKTLEKTHPHLVPYPRAMEASMIAFSIGSAFASRTDYDFYYFLLMMVGTWYTIHRYFLPASQAADQVSSRPAWAPYWAPIPAVVVGPAVPRSAAGGPKPDRAVPPPPEPAPSAPSPRRDRSADSPIRARLK